MEFQLTFESDDAAQKAIAFKKFAEQESENGIENLQVEQAKGKPGDQGIGQFLGSIIGKISSSSSAIKSITDLISRFMELFDGRLIIKDGTGRSLVIPGGRKLTPEQKENIAIHFSSHQ